MKEGAIYEWDFKNSHIVRMKAQIIELVCNEFTITKEELCGLDRKRKLQNARMAYVYLTNRHTKDTYLVMAEFLERHVSSISHMVRTLENLIFIKDPIVKSIRNIENQLLTQ